MNIAVCVCVKFVWLWFATGALSQSFRALVTFTGEATYLANIKVVQRPSLGTACWMEFGKQSLNLSSP